MQAHRPPISRHRVARLNAWFSLWLCWVAAVCAAWWGEGGRAGPRTLDRVARAVRDFILMNAGERYRAPFVSGKHRHGRLKPWSLRTVAGSTLRRALRGRDLPSRLMAILAAVRDAPTHMARLLLRLSRGLTRLRVILPARCRDLFEQLCSGFSAPCPDTS